MKKIIFCTASSRKILPPIIKENKGNELVLIQLDLWLEDLNLDGHMILKEYKDYISIEDCLKIDESALEFVKNWYKPDGIDLTEYRGYSLAELITIRMYKFFIRVLKDILLVQRVVEKEFADEVIIFDDQGAASKIFLNALSENGIKVKKIDTARKPYLPVDFERSEIPQPPMHFFGWIKSILQDMIWRVINIGLFIANNKYRKAKKPKLRVFFDTYTGYFGLWERLFSQFDCEVLLPQPSLNDYRHINFLRRYFKGKVTFYPVKYNKKCLSPLIRMEAEGFPSKCWQRFINCHKTKQHFTWRGVNFWDAMSEDLYRRHFMFFSELIMNISYADYIIRKYKPNVFLVPWDDATLNRSFVSLAKKLHLLTIRYQHGMVANVPYIPMPRSDKLLVWGEHSRHFYLKKGIPPEKIIITGNPMVDIIARKKLRANRLKFCKKQGLDPARKIILYADATFEDIDAMDDPYNNNRVLLKLIDVANKLRDIQFLIKFHHVDAVLGLEKEKIELIKSHSKFSNIFTFSRFDIYALIANSDVVITEFSTVGLEAMLLDKPVIIFKLRQGYTDYVSPYEDGRGVVTVDKEDDIVPTIKRLFVDSELLKKLDAGRKEFLKYVIADFVNPAPACRGWVKINSG